MYRGRQLIFSSSRWIVGKLSSIFERPVTPDDETVACRPRSTRRASVSFTCSSFPPKRKRRLSSASST